MNILKFLLGFFLIFNLHFFSFAQDIVGSWKWTNDKYEGIAIIDSNTYYSSIYFKGTQAKVLEIFNYYHYDKNRIYFLDKPYSGELDKKTATVYRLRNESNSGFQLAGSSGTDTYSKLSASGEVRKYSTNEFYATPILTCIGENESKTNAGKCLSIANINFYNSLEDIKNTFGRVYQSGYDQDNNIWYAFLTEPGDKKGPILTVTLKDEKIIRLNLKGYVSKNDVGFSSIRLGDYSSFVKQRLGDPAFKKEVKAAGDETWVYTSVPISIVFRFSKVSSITIEPFQL
jgi:hypothetical protein